MESPPSGLGTAPGWGHSPATSVRAACPADPSPQSCDDPPVPTGDRILHALRGGAALGLQGAAAGAAIGAIIGSIFPGIGTLVGLGVGAAIGGGLGAVLGLIAGAL